MKNIYITIVAAFICVKLNAQTFNITFSIDSQVTNVYTMQVKDSFIFVGGTFNDTTFDHGIKSYLAKFNLGGQMLSYVTLRPPKYREYIAFTENSLTSTIDGGFAAVGYARDTSIFGRGHSVFTKFDSLGNIQFYKLLDSVFIYEDLNATELLQYDANRYYITGSISYSGHVRVFIGEIDSVGNIIFLQDYALLKENFASNLTKLKNGNILISGYSVTNTLVSYPTYTRNTFFIEVDTLGVQKNIFITTDNTTMVGENTTVTPDSNYMSCGTYCIQYSGYPEPNFNYKPEITKRDTNFNILWDVKIGPLNYDSKFYDFKVDAGNGDAIVCGSTFADTGIYVGINGILCSINSIGKVEWYKAYYALPNPLPIATQNLKIVAILPDGTILAAGNWKYHSVFNIPLAASEMGWLLRVNPDGCMDDGTCGLTDIDQDNALQTRDNVAVAQISPNPSSGIFNITALAKLPAESAISISDIRGKHITTEVLNPNSTLLNLTNIPSGVYLYQIKSGANSVQMGKLSIIR
jgi:hypothetical protein